MLKEMAKGTAAPLVLRVLKDGPQHGYGILQEIKARTGEVLGFTEGAIYPLLHNLEHEGLVSAEWQMLPSGRRRKVYQLTGAGLERLTSAKQEWLRFRTAVDSVLA